MLVSQVVAPSLHQEGGVVHTEATDVAAAVRGDGGGGGGVQGPVSQNFSNVKDIPLFQVLVPLQALVAELVVPTSSSLEDGSFG